MEQFPIVIHSLNVGFLQTLKLFFATLLGAIPLGLVIFGSAGQVIFTLRFVYQYIYSKYKHQSTLPMGFWAISLFGSSVIIAYGIFRLDPVLILGQSFGFVAYIRNLVIGFKERKTNAVEPEN